MAHKERNAPLLVAGVLLILVRNHLIVWLSLLCIIGAICMHGYYLKRIYDIAQE